MFIKVFLIAVLAVLYGLAWHNQPAKPAEVKARDNRAADQTRKPDPV